MKRPLARRTDASPLTGLSEHPRITETLLYYSKKFGWKWKYEKDRALLGQALEKAVRAGRQTTIIVFGAGADLNDDDMQTKSNKMMKGASARRKC